MEDQVLLLFAYWIFIFIQALLINGVYISGSGETTILPDGTEKDSEMILYPLRKFLCQKYTIQKYYINNVQAERLVKRINDFRKITVLTYAGNGIFVYNNGSTKHEIQELLINFDSDHVIDTSRNHEGTFEIFKFLEEYRFSKYIRKPIIQCIICMASFWGFFTYWIPVYAIFGLTTWTFFIWIANTFILSYVNFLIFKPK